MTESPKTNQPASSSRVGLVSTIVLLVAIPLIAWSTLSQSQASCEVCIVFRGVRECRSASSPSREEAVRTATNNACAQLASGMDDSIRCDNTPPASVTCQP